MTQPTTLINGKKTPIRQRVIAAKRFWEVKISGNWHICYTSQIPPEGIICPGCGCYCEPTERSGRTLCIDCDAELQFDRKGLPPERHIIQMRRGARGGHDEQVSENDQRGGMFHYKVGGGKI